MGNQETTLKFAKICVVGLGYIGLPTASTFAANGLQVAGVDINQSVIETLQRGDIHIHEPGLRGAVEAALRSSKLTVSTQTEEADAFHIAVPPPFYEDRHGNYEGYQYKMADLRAVTAAAEAIVPVLRKGNLVILESTSPPRTTVVLVAPILSRSGLRVGEDIFVCYSPERVMPGQILRELIENARVIGGINLASAQAGADLYSIFVKGEIFQTDATTAEMVKLMENTYRDVNIAVANEFSQLADHFEVSVWAAIELANRHPRVKILSPGPGVGGHCISVDPWFFVEAAPQMTPLIYAARQVNYSQRQFVVCMVRRAAGGLNGKKIAVLGLAYKPDVDDLRESPAVAVVTLLQKAGAQVQAWEPFRMNPDLPGIHAATNLESALKDTEVILLLVRHSAFVNLTPADIASRTQGRLVIDTVNGWNAQEQ